MWDGYPQKSHIDVRLLFTICSPKMPEQICLSREGETILWAWAEARGSLPLATGWNLAMSGG
jgi:hypothetical protein